MKVVWRLKDVSVREVYETLRERRPVAYTTVMTMMNTLEGKGYLKRAIDGRAFRYRPADAGTPRRYDDGQGVRGARLRRIGGSAAGAPGDSDAICPRTSARNCAASSMRPNDGSQQHSRSSFTARRSCSWCRSRRWPPRRVVHRVRPCASPTGGAWACCAWPFLCFDQDSQSPPRCR